MRLIRVEHDHTPMRAAIFARPERKGDLGKFEALSFVDVWYVKTYD